ncbi:AAA family ATPase [Actinoallomurus sp. NPDC052274]|uniref:AAA family ATPase n=1 Tax=Actinoallomurus sp. NPDC052274 TaxID=3155420 RepID=UPI003445B7DE
MHVAKLDISGVRGFYGDRSVALDFSRPDGSLAGWTVLAGTNGSGKSTLLQALALLLAGPHSTAFIPSLADWMSNGCESARMEATLHLSGLDSFQPTLFDSGGTEPRVWMEFRRPIMDTIQGQVVAEPDLSGVGVDSQVRNQGMGTAAGVRYQGIGSAAGMTRGLFYVGYGPFRHLGTTGTWRRRAYTAPKVERRVASLFDESVSLADAVDWLIEQHLYQLEGRPGAAEFLETVLSLLGDGLLPDGFRVHRVDSDGLWVSHQDAEFPLREMSDGYRAVTALVVDIVRQMNAAYRGVTLEYQSNTPTLPYPGVVLIDEVDAHLHVSWQKAIGTWLKEHFPQIQFIVTTHSPYICQSADPGGLILLPGPNEHTAPHPVEGDLYERVIYGSGDDAILSDLFGVSSPYSPVSEKLRRRLGDLEVKVLDGSASEAEMSEYRRLTNLLTSSLSARVDEVAARLSRGE